MTETIVKTLHVKVRRAHWAWLDAAAAETNLVWNHLNEQCHKAARPFYGPGKWLSGYDATALVKGAHEELTHLPQATVNCIAIEHGQKRQVTRKTQLAWRASSGARRALGWVPFRKGQVLFKDGAAVLKGKRFRVFDSYGLSGYELRGGSFAQNSLGEWFLNVCVQVKAERGSLPARAVGIDLGLKDIAVTSDGETLPAGRWTRAIEPKVAQAQRRGHKRQAKRFQKDAANRRKDALHKFSTSMVERYGAIYVGDVSSLQLAKTRMAKSVHDAGWGMLRTMLQSKGDHAGRIVQVVNERNTTRACSDCGALTGPRGRRELVVREWVCGACGAAHGRDVNAARNILALGLQGPSAGTGRRHALSKPNRPGIQTATPAAATNKETL